MWIKDNQVFNNHSEVRFYMERLESPVSLPAVITDEILAEFDFTPVTEVKPPFNPRTEKLVVGEPEEVDGVWTLPYTVVALTAEERKAQVPAQVTARQAISALIITTGPSGNSLYDDVMAAFEAIEDPVDRKLAQVDLEHSQFFERRSQRVQTIGAIVGLDESQMDDLFVFASTIPA